MLESSFESMICIFILKCRSNFRCIRSENFGYPTNRVFDSLDHMQISILEGAEDLLFFGFRYYSLATH